MDTPPCEIYSVYIRRTSQGGVCAYTITVSKRAAKGTVGKKHRGKRTESDDLGLFMENFHGNPRTQLTHFTQFN